MTVKIATYNINSVRARLPQLLEWLKSAAPDIVLLQELKCLEEAFPRMEIEELGYNLAISGQKTYNGVAILSKFPLEDVVRKLPGEDTDEEARYIEAVATTPHGILRVASIYVPNGQEPGSERFQYKLRFFDRLHAHAKTLLAYEEKLVLGADYNVAPAPIDVFDPVRLDGTTCYHPEERKRFHRLLHLGLTDAFRALHPDEEHAFSWWDYRGGSWDKNEGMRIDHLLLSPLAADAIKAAGIDIATRGKDKASDHAPVWVELAIS